jgi:hypothetical protein
VVNENLLPELRKEFTYYIRLDEYHLFESDNVIAWFIAYDNNRGGQLHTFYKDTARTGASLFKRPLGHTLLKRPLD